MDPVLKAFLNEQLEEGMHLASESDILDLCPRPDAPPNQYLARLQCRVLVKTAGGIEESNWCKLGIYLPDDYLRQTDSVNTVTWLGPRNTFHPNVNPPFFCIGKLPPGTPLVEILYQIFDIVTYRKWAADDPLNLEASQWARNHQERFPLDERPFKRRRLDLDIRVVE